MSLTPASHHLTSDFEHQQHYWYSTAPYSGSVVRTYEYLIQCMDSPKASYTSVAYQVESDTTLHTTMVVGRGSRSCCAVCGAVEVCVLCVGPVCWSGLLPVSLNSRRRTKSVPFIPGTRTSIYYSIVRTVSCAVALFCSLARSAPTRPRSAFCAPRSRPPPPFH